MSHVVRHARPVAAVRAFRLALAISILAAAAVVLVLVLRDDGGSLPAAATPAAHTARPDEGATAMPSAAGTSPLAIARWHRYQQLTHVR